MSCCLEVQVHPDQPEGKEGTLLKHLSTYSTYYHCFSIHQKHELKNELKNASKNAL